MPDQDFEELEIKLVRTFSSPRASRNQGLTIGAVSSESKNEAGLASRRDLEIETASSLRSEISSILELHSYEVQARSSRGRFAKEPLEFTVTQEDLAKLLNQGPCLQAEEIERLGQELFDSIFTGQTRVVFFGTNEDAIRRKKRLRIRIRVEPPELARIPWEIVRPEKWSTIPALSGRTPVFREEELIDGYGSLLVNGPLRIMLVSASPADQKSLDLEGELRLIQTQLEPLREAGKVEIACLARAQRRQLEQKLLEFRPHVVHFMMHGDFSGSEQQGLLMLQDDRGKSIPIEADELTSYFEADPDSETRLVIFNACRTAVDDTVTQGRGIAASLARLNVPAIIAMQFSISDPVAIVFADELYRSLIGGQSIEVAVARARREIRDRVAKSLQQEWLIPVLFLRATETRLFEGLGLDRPLTFTPDAAPLRQVAEQVESSTPPEPVRSRDQEADSILEFSRAKGSTFRLRLTASGRSIDAEQELPQDFLQGLADATTFRSGLLDSHSSELFDRLVPGEMAQHLRQTRAMRRKRGASLTLLGDDPLLHATPWEYARDPETGLFVSTGGGRFPLIRQLFDSGALESLSIDGPLRILVVTCNPRDLHPLLLEREREWIREALRDAPPGTVEVEFLIDPMIIHLDEELSRHRYHILHFAGYDSLALSLAANSSTKPTWFRRVDLDELRDSNGQFRLEEGLVLLDEQGRMKCLYADDFCDFLAPFDSLRLVVMNTCFTATRLAPMLVRSGIPAAIGMRYGVNDEVAVRFALAFYKSLIHLSLDPAAALADTRRILKLVMTERQYGGHWGFPCLYTSVRGAKVFGAASAHFHDSRASQQGAADSTVDGPPRLGTTR